MTIEKYSKLGDYHRGINKENQDYLWGIEDRDYIAVMLADGATACEQGLEGAKLACEAVIEVIQQEGITFFQYQQEKIRYLITEQILYYLEKYKDSECDMSEYGSTFVLAFMEKKTGRTVLINLGDGAILLSKEDGYRYLLRPRKYGGKPCLTTTQGVNQAMEIDVVQLDLGNRVLLCSDGFLRQLSKCKVSIMLHRCNIEGLNQTLQSEYSADDCSYISFRRERE